ncbi:protein ALTERED PHOSPHATE STARVATION RESPONSE 1 [Syzygium oleosum]|uniref:protein ALTERED PHOSPHATE STARVATION RESPONSE 1 n=1 Tax=Syzygium oleosum TaxID=219896 RepID=UPI0011D1E227|nr:protein ALTERED PHOSPHATE STARVATION RESPONSE 1 [Syzygium oleosum]
MGSANTKLDRNEALRLCKARKKFIKEGINSRCALAAAHVSYIQSLKNVGVALRRYAEAEILIESSLSTSATEIEKTPSHSSYPSPSPSHVVDVSDSPLNNGSPLSPLTTRMSFMKSGGSTSVTICLNPLASTRFLDDGTMAFGIPPPPPLPPESGGSWDFFDPIDENESFRFDGQCGVDMNFESFGNWSQFKGEKLDHLKVNSSEADVFHDAKSVLKSETKDCLKSGDISTTSNSHSLGVESTCKLITLGGLQGGSKQGSANEARQVGTEYSANDLGQSSQDKGGIGRSSSKVEMTAANKDLGAEREDPSEYITHRAKDFLSSIKDIEHKFFRASESGKEVSRMLEGNKIRVRYTEEKGQSSSSALLGAFQHVCCRQKPPLISHEPGQNGKRMIIWKRTTSSRSSSSRNHLNGAPKDDVSDSGSDFIEEFCMISGSHSSTLDRLFAWERKLYDEVKASESIRKEYDKKCDQLRHQFAKGCSTHVIDKTRAVVKDLHSRIQVALHSVDSISKRIEKMRDDELQPQLVELIQGFIRMWKAMLECHHAQYITISLAYHSKVCSGMSQGDAWRLIMDQLQQEIECFGLSFANWINSLTSYVEALNGWLQHCIIQPPERSKYRRPWSPRRVLAPPIFSLFRDWAAGIKALPSSELNDAIRSFLSDLYDLTEHQAESQRKQRPCDSNNGGPEEPDEGKNECAPSNLSCIQTSLTKVLDRLRKFSEASLKMYEDIRHRTETAGVAYSNCKPARSKTV